MKQFIEKASPHFEVEIDYCEKFRSLVQTVMKEDVCSD
jgi:hypothetical protein